MKKSFYILLLIFISGQAVAQQEQQYTQFMYNKLSLNPAYAGSKEVACLSAIFRRQWIGLEGAPETILLSFHGLSKSKRIGLGLNFSRNSIGVSEKWTTEGMYAYRIKVGEATLGVGLQASVRYYGVDYTDSRLVSNTPLVADGAIEFGAQGKYLPNFGAGAYLSGPKFYLGLSLPRLIKNDLDFNEVGSVLSTEVRHLYVMGGFTLELVEGAILYPQVLLKYAPNSPIDADLNLNLLLGKIITVGGTYRMGGSGTGGSGESFDLILGAQLSPRIFIGMSYDMTLSELRNYNQGSVEALVQYCFVKRKAKEFVNPRYF